MAYYLVKSDVSISTCSGHLVNNSPNSEQTTDVGHECGVQDIDAVQPSSDHHENVLRVLSDVSQRELVAVCIVPSGCEWLTIAAVDRHVLHGHADRVGTPCIARNRHIVTSDHEDVVRRGVSQVVCRAPLHSILQCSSRSVLQASCDCLEAVYVYYGLLPRHFETVGHVLTTQID